MDAEHKLFVSLLSGFINEVSVQISEPPDWAQIIKLGKIHNVSGILSFMVRRLPLEQQPEKEVVNKLRSKMNATIVNSTERINAAQRLIEQLADLEIDVTLMKGFVIRKLYPVEELRTFGDVDFFIRQKDRGSSHRLMLQLGYEAKKTRGEVWEYQKKNEHYEFHSQIMQINSEQNEAISSYFEDAWNHVIPMEGTHCYKFAPEYHLLYLLAHLAKHMYESGAGIRMFMDISLLILRSELLDWQYIWDELRKLQLDVFAGCVFSLCERWFSVSPPNHNDQLQDELYEVFCKYVLSAGAFGFYDRNPALSKVREQQGKNQSVLWSAKQKMVVGYVFPSFKKLVRRYEFLKGRPFLLPAAWVLRYYEGLFKKRKKAAATLSGVLHDTDESEKQYQLFQQLGLMK